MKKYICVDIGGTNTRVQIRNAENKIESKITFETNQKKPKITFNKIIEFINSNKESDIQGIGISAPGPTDYEKGIFFDLPNNPGWRDFEFKKYLKEKTGIENIVADNDANLMALAHHFEFKKSDKDITQFFTVSTGLGSGLIIDNKIYVGSNHYAQEVAFVPVSWIDEKSPKFGKGALEYFSAGSGILDRTKGKYSSTKEVFENYKKDEFATKIINDGIDTLGNMIAVTVALINPSILVFDGSVSRKNEWYIDAAIENAKKNSSPHHFKNLSIYIGNKGDDAALDGAFLSIKKN